MSTQETEKTIAEQEKRLNDELRLIETLLNNLKVVILFGTSYMSDEDLSRLHHVIGHMTHKWWALQEALKKGSNDGQAS